MSRQLIFETSTNDPQQYYWFQSALSKEEVDKVIAMAGKLPEGEKATTIGSEDVGLVIRSNDDSFCRG